MFRMYYCSNIILLDGMAPYCQQEKVVLNFPKLLTYSKGASFTQELFIVYKLHTVYMVYSIRYVYI